MSVINSMLDDIKIPKFMRIRQHFDAFKIEDIEGTITKRFQEENIKCTIKAGQKIGITVGSRGIANLKDIVQSVCNNIKNLGATPVILPSMGSHGAATAEGQKEVLKALGIVEEDVGAEIIASMEVIQLGTTDIGLPVYYDKVASKLDGVIVLNRIKAHTDLIGDVESGLQKIITIGLGNHEGAQVIHAKGLDKAVPRLKSVAEYVLNHANIILGIGLLENAYDETSDIEFIPTNKITELEPKLLEKSKEQLPQFLFNDIDVLVVDYFGKNISGDGMDPNIIGRGMIGYKNKNVRINKIVTLDTTPESGSNAFGVGLSDVTTRRVFDKMELEAMYANAITAIAINGVKIPIAMDNDRLAIQLAIRAACVEDNGKVRIARVKNTLDLKELYISEALLEDVRDNDKVEILSDLEELDFNPEGNLL